MTTETKVKQVFLAPEQCYRQIGWYELATMFIGGTIAIAIKTIVVVVVLRLMDVIP